MTESRVWVSADAALRDEEPAVPEAAPAAPPQQLAAGTFALYEKSNGGMHVSLLLAGEAVERHHDVPPFVVRNAARMAGLPGDIALRDIIAQLIAGNAE
jgi:hypothetical protein